MARRWPLSLGLAVVWLALGASTPLHDEDERRAALRKQIQEQMESGEWSKAAATIKKLKRTAEGQEKEELEALLRRANGEAAWAKIESAREASAKPKRLLRLVERFLEKHGENKEFRRRARTLREETLQGAICMVADFEERKTAAHRGRTVLVQDRVMGGENALRWISESPHDDYLFLDSPETDWSKYDSLYIWIHCEKPQGTITLSAISKYDPDHPDAFCKVLRLKWRGWRRMRLPLRGKTFSKKGRPDWASIQTLCLEKKEGATLDLIVDEVCLEKTTK